MKKASKLISVILAGIMLFSIFTVSVSAEEMTKEDVVKFYHGILKETASKNKVVLVNNEYDSVCTPDLSALSGLDLKLTEKLFTVFDGLEVFEDGEIYYYGVDNEYQEPSDTEIYDTFSISWELEIGYTLKDATYADNKIVIVLESDAEYSGTEKITIDLADSNVIKKITKEISEEMEADSLIKNIPFMVSYESVDTYTFKYEEVPATSLTLAETSVTLGYGDTAEITYTVGPENASFKGVYVYDAENEDGIIASAYEEDGKIIIEEWGEGIGTVEVYTVSGDILATCEVTVEYSMWDRIRMIFDEIFFWLGIVF